MTEEELEKGVKSDATMLLLYQAIAEQEGWDNITEKDFEEVTGTADNAAFIEQYGRGYIAKYVIYKRASEYIMDHIKVE